MEKKEKIYEGKTKIIYSTKYPRYFIQHFKDDATAFNGKKKDQIKEKGIYNCAISSLIFEHLEENAINTHFVEKLNEREMLVEKVNIIPIEVVMRNYASGSLVKRLGIEEGKILFQPIIEYYYKNDDLNDPLINEHHIQILRLADSLQVTEMHIKSFRINTILKILFSKINIHLVDFKLEFGSNGDGNILLADEISPDGCRLWDMKTGNILDKDIFRKDLGDLIVAYKDVYDRLRTR